jgi:hypothetical protein
VSEENPIMFPTNTTVPNAVDIVIDNSTPIRTAHGDKSTSRVTTANFPKSMSCLSQIGIVVLPRSLS